MKKDANNLNDETQIDFETALIRLDEIVSALENGNSKLESSLLLFEEGVGLIRACNEKLEQAEQKVKILVNNGNGSYDEQDFTKTE